VSDKFDEATLIWYRAELWPQNLSDQEASVGSSRKVSNFRLTESISGGKSASR
jgi:hypothetical protein